MVFSTLHHLESSQEQPVPRWGFELSLPGIGCDAIPPGIIPGTAGSPPVWATTPLEFFRTVTPPGISPPAEGERSPVYSPVPPSISAALCEGYYGNRRYWKHAHSQKGPGIVEDTATPPSPVCEYKTFAAYGCNPLVVANLYRVLNSRYKDLVRKAVAVVLRSSF